MNCGMIGYVALFFGPSLGRDISEFFEGPEGDKQTDMLAALTTDYLR